MRTISLLRAKIEGTTFLGGGFERLRERDQAWVVPVAVVGILVAVVGFVVLLYQNYRGMAMLGVQAGVPDLVFYVAIVAGWAIVFILGFPVAISVLYFSRDTRLLASLPIPAHRIVAANAGLLYLYGLPVAALFVVPALVAGAPAVSALGTGIVRYWAAGAVVTVLLPVVPLALSALIVTGITRLVNLSRYRTGLEALGMVLLVVVLVGLQVALSRSLADDGAGVAVSGALGSFVVGLRDAVPPAGWYAAGFTAGRLGVFAAACGGTLAVGAGAIAVVGRGYLLQLANQTVTRTRRRRATPGAMPPEHAPLTSLVMREVKLLTSNSTFLFESVGEVFVFPIILLILRLATPGEVIAQIVPRLDRTDLLLPIVVAALVLFAGINSVSSAALSREGRTFDLSLSLPVPGSTQVAAKIVTYLVLFGGALAINAVLATWILARPWWYAPVIVVCGLPFIWLIGTTTVYADLRRPHLNWNHPQQAVKQNMNVVIGMGIAVVALGVAATPAAVAAARGAPAGLVLVLGAGLALVGAAVIGRLVLRYADRRYANAFARG
ncbi:MAG: hypothetical protein ACOC2D_06275 [Spirochaetota bacterium]